MRSSTSSTYARSGITEQIPGFQTACGRRLLVPPKAQVHLAAHPEVMTVLPEAVSRLRLLRVEFVETEIEMGRVVGRAGLVATPPGNLHTPMLFAQRIGRPAPSRVVPSDTSAPETTKVAVVAQPSRDYPGAYSLVTSWIGGLARKEPWDRNLKSAVQRQESVEFWCKHALIHDPGVMGEIFESTWHEVLRRVQLQEALS